MGAPFGNQNNLQNKPFRDAIDRACAQEDGKRLRGAAEKLLNLAEAGEPWAIKELADRVDGRAHQSGTVEFKGASLAEIILGMDKAEKNESK